MERTKIPKECDNEKNDKTRANNVTANERIAKNDKSRIEQQNPRPKMGCYPCHSKTQSVYFHRLLMQVIGCPRCVHSSRCRDAVVAPGMKFREKA